MLQSERFADVLTVKRYKKNRGGIVAKIIGIGCASCLIAGGIGFGIASAGSGAADTGTFGVGSATASTSTAVAATGQAEVSDISAREATVLTSTASRDITQGIDSINEKKEAERRAAEEAARLEEEARIAAAEQAKAEQQASVGMASLTDVDWSVGKDAFISEWTARIDAYLAGSPLAGQGVTFATAAWNNGVDPRWSPAISNTESSKGLNCFLPYNAWGWGQSSWSSWEEAINAHVAGLASSYGYTISYGFAQKYCPPNYHNWFNNTLAQMQMI